MKYKAKPRSNRQSWPMKALTASIAIGIMGSFVHANSATSTSSRKPIGDLEIYKAAKPGTASIFMMLDTSGSMTDYDSSCKSGSSKILRPDEAIRLVNYKRKFAPDSTSTDIKFLLGENGQPIIDFNDIANEFTFTPKGCYGTDNKLKVNRIERLQIALIELLADRVYNANNTLKETGALPDNYAIGLGHYSYDGDGKAGVVLVPTAELTAEQRVKLINKVNGLRATGNTPTANALAESGAYMMGTTTRGGGQNSYSGFNDSVSSSKNDGKYISPLSTKECSGNGIYILTDGQPNGGSPGRSKGLMNASLSGSNPSLSVSSCANLTGDSDSRSWGCMATYAALLRNPANNKLGLPIKTATVGFGKDFAGLTGKRTITVNGESKEVVDCDSGNANDDTRNLCKLGERRSDGKVKSFGDGGFYYTEESEDIAKSIVDFSSSLVQIINTAPSGTITIPEDPYRAANQLPYAYLPMLDPDIISASSIWKGNLKKYNLDQGTLFGKDSNKLYKDVAGKLDENTQDEWQTIEFKVGNVAANNNIAAGGVYAQLRTPSSGLESVRTLYVEDYTSSDNKTPILREIGVNGSGKPFGFDALIDTVAYSQLNQRRLLSFLGFGSALTNGGQATDSILVENLNLDQPTKEIKVLGGVVHSKPEAISYGSFLDDKGNIIDPREDYVLFGSMDGALHLVDAKEGIEEFAIIPRQMLIKQPEALVDGSIKDAAKSGEPYFGVDAPWLVKTDYNYDLAGKKVTVDTTSGKGMFAYGGLRMGGEAFYGMDITKKAEPKILFTITPQGISSTTSGKSATTGFERLGQIWSKPVAAKIRLTNSSTTKNTAPTDVLIFGGGYDMGYEEDDYVPTSAAPAKGSAIYMVNAKTGELIWSTSSAATSGKNIKIDSMINSITGGITVLDRDNDGLIDHIYAADLGGQVFRADFENARIEQFGFAAVNSFANKGVTRILNVTPTNKKLAYRFYESPIVSFFRRESGPDNGKLFAMVNLISGNRSAPLSTLRNDNDYANRVYGIIDNDVTHADLFKGGFTKTIDNLTEVNLVNLGNKIATIASKTTNPTRKTEKEKAIADMIGAAQEGGTAAVAASKNGWFYPLTRFDGYSNVRYNKGVGNSVVINNLLYTSVYNPDKIYGNAASCTAKITGGSERQIYCLPYGVCMEDTSISGTGGFVPAGQGIQELALGAYNADNTDVKVLIGTTTIVDRIKAANRAKYGEDTVKDASNIKDQSPGESNRPTTANGDGSAVEYLFNERYTMQPKAWYERK